MTPMEAAVTELSRDMMNLLRLARQLRDQGAALESFARLLTLDMDQVKAAVRQCVSQTSERNEK